MKGPSKPTIGPTQVTFWAPVVTTQVVRLLVYCICVQTRCIIMSAPKQGWTNHIFIEVWLGSEDGFVGKNVKKPPPSNGWSTRWATTHVTETFTCKNIEKVRKLSLVSFLLHGQTIFKNKLYFAKLIIHSIHVQYYEMYMYAYPQTLVIIVSHTHHQGQI